MQTSKEKQELFQRNCMSDEKYKELTEREQSELYTRLVLRV